LLNVEQVGVRFGGVVALDGLSFAADDGQICALIGPNGAGKTTLFNVVSGLYQPNEGRVSFDGHDLLSVPAHRIVQLGVARTFQNVALFPALSVLDNVMMGAHRRGHTGFARSIVRLGVAREEHAGGDARAGGRPEEGEDQDHGAAGEDGGGVEQALRIDHPHHGLGIERVVVGGVEEGEGVHDG